MQYLVVRISETGGNPWMMQVDNLSREDATEKEKTMADEIEVVVMAYLKQRMKPGTAIAYPKPEGSRVI